MTRADCGSQPVKVSSISKSTNLLGFGEFQVAASLRSRALEEMNSALRPRCGYPYAVARQMWRVRWVVSVMALSCMMFACRANKNPSGPAIEFTRVPLATEGGPDRMEPIEGRVIRGSPGQRVVLFAHWGTWWVQPLVDHPFTTIQPDSKWRSSTHFGTEYAALLVDATYQPPARIDFLPSTGHGVVAVAVVEGRPVFWQTWWFLLTATLASAVIVAACFRYRMVRLANEEQKFREAIETMPAMALITRSDGYCTFVNRGWVEFTGLTVERSSGSGWQAAVHPDDLSRVVNRWRASLASGEPLEHEVRVGRVADGAYRWFLIRAVPLRDKRGKILKWCGAATDIEDRQRAQQLQASLTHINRVNSMGELVASISHELLQPITATTLNAKTSLRWLQRDPPDLTQVREGTEKIIEAVTRASEIIDRLRSLYKKAAPKRELVAMNEVVSEMAGMLRSEATRHGVSIRTDLKDDLPMTAADRVQLQQVLMNLMLNGIEAMSETGGVLTVKSQLGPDGKIQISVNDTGPGLPPGKSDQLFEAFFTTKPQGSGMGLSISKSIVEAHGGRIWATMNGGCGATFHFALPSAAEEANNHDTVT
ncbi:PAS domain S-box-containing protein [Edaphobacter modestus]|uniref:histidine kinase n=2 Tax=Edaphobacter modestus TaxID=388466 RepID=A0A4Q7YZL7_9BACT|nr:PAS domain S-box-containing protein [Edaphobacter modestus]